MLDCFPMTRLFVFFWLLSAFPAAFAFAPDSSFGLNPSDIRINANPNTPQFRMGPGGQVFTGNGPVPGSAVVNRTIGASIGTSNFNVNVSRTAVPSALARAGRLAVRASGWGALLLLGVDVVGWIWDDDEQDYVVPIPSPYPPDFREGIWCFQGSCGYSYHGAMSAFISASGGWYVSWSLVSINDAAGTFVARVCNVNDACSNYSGSRTGPGCPVGWSPSDKFCIPPQEYRPVSDTDIETLIENDITTRDRGGPYLDALRDLDSLPDFGPRLLIGPQTIPGETTTSTTTGPAGTTTTTTTTTHDLTYAPDQIDIRTNETTVVTHPDGTTTTTETEHLPPVGSDGVPVEDIPVFDLCAEYPNISACQELGEPDEDFDLDGEDVYIDLDYNSTSGSCPAPRVISTHVGSYSLSWGPFCDFALGIRPIVILLSLISAFWFVLYVARK